MQLLQLPSDDDATQEFIVESLPSTSAGRPVISFTEGGDRTKRRKTKELRDKYSSSELAYAAQMSLRSAGQKDAAKLIYEAIETTPTRPTKMREAWIKSRENLVTSYSPDEALALFIDTKLTKSQYIKIRVQAKSRNADIYPSYQKVRVAKKACYPPDEAVIVTESFMEVKLQALLDLTAKRIILAQEEVFANISDDVSKELTLVSKWGCDGSTGHSEYKQRSSDSFHDSDMFITSFVPLQLYTTSASSKKYILWQNSRPSSVRYCRPIRLQFVKETAELSKQETEYIEKQIVQLLKTEVRVKEQLVFVKHQMALTMLDGKVCNAITSTTSAQKCYICNAVPTKMNDLKSVSARKVDEETYRFGLSSLHAWIRFFECFIHIAYRLDFKKWQVRQPEERKMFEIRKKRIQQDFKDQLGLLIDHVKPGGSGTSNDGNTARRFFKDTTTSAKITGIDQRLLQRCSVILEAIASGFRINLEAFENYALETANLYVQLYPWYYMPVSMHKILIHGPSIIAHALLPMGQLSEEAQESRNKDLKVYRRSHTRKTSRQTTNQDLLNLLIVSSDPFITSLRKLPQKFRKRLSQEVLQLLSPPEEEESDLDLTSASEEDSLSETQSDSD